MKLSRSAASKRRRTNTRAQQQLDTKLAEQELQAQLLLVEVAGPEMGSLSLLHDIVAQTASLSMHVEEAGEREEEKKEEEKVEKWFSEEECVEEEEESWEENEFEPEPEEP